MNISFEEPDSEPSSSPDSRRSDSPGADASLSESARANGASCGASNRGGEAMTAEQLHEARRKGRIDLACDVADKALDVAVLAAIAFFLASPLDGWLAGPIPSPAWRLPALFLIVTAIHLAVSFPLSFFSGFVVEHRFGLSRQSFVRWLTRYLAFHALGTAMGLLVFWGLYWLIWTTGRWWQLAAAAAFFLVSVVLGRIVPVLILPLFYKIERIENADLAERFARLAAGTGLTVEGTYRMRLSSETAKANAMLAGMGRSRRVLLGDTLLDNFTPEEIEVIFAHEVGHHVFGHIRKMVATGVASSIAGFAVCDRALALAAGSIWGEVDYANLPVATLPLLMLALTIFSLALLPANNFLSRRYERQCDRYALERTGLREAYLSAFRKLAKLNKDHPDPHPLEVFLLHDHPPIAERLAMGENHV